MNELELHTSQCINLKEVNKLQKTHYSYEVLKHAKLLGIVCGYILVAHKYENISGTLARGLSGLKRVLYAERWQVS